MSVRARRTKELRGKQGLQDVGLLWCLSLDLRFGDPRRVAAALFTTHGYKASEGEEGAI